MKVAIPLHHHTAEAEISRKSAICVMSALKQLGHTAVEIPVVGNFVQELQRINPDVVFNAMHGKFGEDGNLPAILNTMQIPYTHSGVSASKIGMNKIVTNIYANAIGIHTIETLPILRQSFLSGNYSITQKSVIKPARGGSSVATFILEADQRLSQAQLDEISSYQDDDLFVIQKFIKGREVCIGILNGRAVGSVEIAPSEEFFTYNAKYNSNQTQYFVPAQIPQELHHKIAMQSENLHNAIGASCISRADFIITEQNEPVFLEINTHPGLTETSLLPKICKSCGISYNELVQTLLSNAKFEII